MIFMVLIGAMLLSNFINIAGFPQALSDFVSGLGWGPAYVIVALTLIYFVLGCLLESISMMLLTVPVFYPVILAAGIDPIWFGVFVVVVIEIGMITPPIGLNAFVIKATAPDIKISEVFVGLVPFVAVDLLRIVLLVVFPTIVLLLPRLFY